MMHQKESEQARAFGSGVYSPARALVRLGTLRAMCNMILSVAFAVLLLLFLTTLAVWLMGVEVPSDDELALRMATQGGIGYERGVLRNGEAGDIKSLIIWYYKRLQSPIVGPANPELRYGSDGRAFGTHEYSFAAQAFDSAWMSKGARIGILGWSRYFVPRFPPVSVPGDSHEVIYGCVRRLAVPVGLIEAAAVVLACQAAVRMRRAYVNYQLRKRGRA